jgi:hypothetical protein
MYTQPVDDRILDERSRSERDMYVLRVRDLPSEEKPREKLLNHGVSCLSTSELLAVIMNTGTKKEGVLEMSGRIAKDYGEGGIMSQKDPLILSKDLGVPIGKSVILVACGCEVVFFAVVSVVFVILISVAHRAKRRRS